MQSSKTKIFVNLNLLFELKTMWICDNKRTQKLEKKQTNKKKFFSVLIKVIVFWFELERHGEFISCWK